MIGQSIKADVGVEAPIADAAVGSLFAIQAMTKGNGNQIENNSAVTSADSLAFNAPR
jgi:hypothetical protein